MKDSLRPYNLASKFDDDYKFTTVNYSLSLQPSIFSSPQNCIAGLVSIDSKLPSTNIQSYSRLFQTLHDKFLSSSRQPETGPNVAFGVVLQVAKWLNKIILPFKDVPDLNNEPSLTEFVCI